MKRALFAFVALSACATTPHGIQQLAPKAVFHSDKSAAELEQCLAESKLALLGGPSVIHGPAKTTLAFGSGGITSLMLDIEPPTISARSGYGFSPAYRRWIAACL